MAAKASAVQEDSDSVSGKVINTSGEQLDLLDPATLKDGTIPYPKSLSPSSILEFQKCPQSYLFQYLWSLKQPPNLALAKGSMIHAALEQVYDLEPEHRDLTTLQNLFRRQWAQHRLKPPATNRSTCYVNLFDHEDQPGVRNVEAEVAWGREGLQLLENYVRAEAPEFVPPPNPVQREVWVRANLAVDPSKGCTAYTAPDPPPVPLQSNSATSNAAARHRNDTVLVRGIVDRIDMVRSDDTGDVVLQIVDYKTGKAPHLKYSAAMNDKIRREAALQLQIYALLLRERQQSRENDYEFSSADSNNNAIRGLPIRFLRLFHLTNVNGEAEYVDFDLGATAYERDATLQQVHQEISNVWTSILDLVDTQDPEAFHGCDRSFCYCHKCRQRFVPGSVWEPSLES